MGSRSKAKNKPNQVQRSSTPGRWAPYKKGSLHWDRKTGRYEPGPRPQTFTEALEELLTPPSFSNPRDARKAKNARRRRRQGRC